jgi:alkylhydroperoxidase/carboxymuconolactone decarboxylase family protein
MGSSVMSKLSKRLTGWSADEQLLRNVTGTDGALTKREKALIALAVSHALKCPYCIDVYTTQSLESGANPEQMMEAVHVAAAMQAGITLVHSVQMQNHLDKLVL